MLPIGIGDAFSKGRDFGAWLGLGGNWRVDQDDQNELPFTRSTSCRREDIRELFRQAPGN
jgi:hypothetical protein